MPMIIMCAPAVRERSSAWLRLARMDSSSSAKTGRRELPRRDVDLDVELPELGLEVRIGDRLEDRGVGQRGPAVVVGQVELDLEAERSARRLEALVGQHPREDVQGQCAPSRGSAGDRHG
jgi:hypothetical protein